MSIFKNKHKIFKTIEFDGVVSLFTYPKHLPIPRVGETVLLNGNRGKVLDVKHMTEGDVTEIKIICSKL